MATSTQQQTGEGTRASEGRGQGSAEMQRRDQQRGGMQQRRGGQQYGAPLFSPFGFGPFSLLRRMQEDMDRLLGAVLSPGQGQGQWPGQQQMQGRQAGAGALAAPGALTGAGALTDITPPIETVQRGNEFVIRMDLPGVNADTLEVDITEQAVTVSGERRIEREDERDGVYVTELTYGRFERVIPLPEGAVVEDATARLSNGVLEIVVPAPSREAQRGRRLEIQGGQRAESGQQQQPQQQPR